MQVSKILICGFMGSGKSHFLKKLQSSEQRVEDCSFVDLDSEIHQQEASDLPSLGDWIELVGLEHFRHVETSTLQAWLTHPKFCVIALGGGTLNPFWLDQIGQRIDWLLVHLQCPFEVCYERIREDQGRPLVQQGKVALEQLYRNRLSFYSRARLELNSEQQQQVQGVEDLLLLAKKGLSFKK